MALTKPINTMLANMASSTIKGQVVGGSGAPVDLTGIQARAVVGITPDVILEDQKTLGTGSGTFTSGADQTRDLNTKVYDPNSICTLSSNQFTLGAGTYYISWTAPAKATNEHQSFLYNVTDSTEVKRGSSEYASASGPVANRSFGSTVVTIAGSKAFSIRHRCNTTSASNGFGVNSGFGIEVYTRVEITRVS